MLLQQRHVATTLIEGHEVRIAHDGPSALDVVAPPDGAFLWPRWFGPLASCPCTKPVPMVCFNLGSLRNLTSHGDGPSEECLALIQLGSQKAHLRQEGIAFRGLKLKPEVQAPNIFIVPPCVCTLLRYCERIIRY